MVSDAQIEQLAEKFEDLKEEVEELAEIVEQRQTTAKSATPGVDPDGTVRRVPSFIEAARREGYNVPAKEN